MTPRARGSQGQEGQGLFIGSTRNKVRAARAKINDALFGSGKMPFDTTPTNEKLAPYADVVEKIITEQLERMKFKAAAEGRREHLATYGTGFMFGPFVRKEMLTETSADSRAARRSWWRRSTSSTARTSSLATRWT
jgi:hypothetical protein